MMSATPPWAKHPVSVRGAPSDQIGGITLCLGILSALLARQSQGVGQKVEVSHLSSTMWLQGLAIGNPTWSTQWTEPMESNGDKLTANRMKKRGMSWTSPDSTCPR